MKHRNTVTSSLLFALIFMLQNLISGACLLAYAAPHERVLYSFCSEQNCLDGSLPTVPLISDAQGNLYGTTSEGGSGFLGLGTVFELSLDPDHSWTRTVLYNFCPVLPCTDGESPTFGALTIDAGGNLYGTTNSGGLYGLGVVFELSPTGNGTWSEKVLHSFNDVAGDGGHPWGGLLFDQAGNLFGTGNVGGTYGFGVVFELSPNGDGTWGESILYSFQPFPDAHYPSSPVVMDKHGRLFGTAGWGGDDNYGAIFVLAQKNGQWAERVLHSFSNDGTDGYHPQTELVLDEAGNIYGTTPSGGIYGGGIVFAFSVKNGQAVENILHNFNPQTDGFDPQGGMILNASKKALYGTTAYGLASGCDCGTVYQLTRNQNGQWQERIIYTFNGGSVDGEFPQAGLLFDNAGNLYGTTSFGGGGFGGMGGGTAFEITP